MKVKNAIAGQPRPLATNPTAANWAAPAKTIRLKAIASRTEKWPAVPAVSPNTKPKPTAPTMIPRPSRTSRRRDATSSAGPGAGVTGSAQEGLGAGAVADDEQGVLVERVARNVEEPRTAGGRAFPDPPAVVRIERRRLGLEAVAEPVPLRDEGADPGGSIGLRLARVRVVLADVRGHGRLPLDRWEAGGGVV